MARINRIALSLLGLGVVVAVMSGVNATPIQAASSGAPVMVTNVPLPVSAAQSGDWNVNIANTPSVNITNTPTVGLAAGASVRDADNPALQPFQTTIKVTLSAGAAETSGSFAVPAGKRLVIEYVSGYGEIPIGESLTNVSVNTAVGGTRIEHFFVPTVTGSYNGTVNNNVISAHTRFYADGCDGCYVGVGANRNGTSSNGDFHFSISGYLVNIP